MTPPEIKVIGPGIFEEDANGSPKSRVGTIFPRHKLLITLPGVHASQRMAFVEELNRQRQAEELPLLTSAEEALALENSADLFFEAEDILIRPDPDKMKLAFEADEVLQALVSKRRIKFLFVLHDKVQRAVKERGECWRISSLPRSREGMRLLVQDSKAAITEQAIYYYNRASGTRYLTLQQFAQLERLDAPAPARPLDEIAKHSNFPNRLGN